MNPKKKIPSFCFESPHLKPFDLDIYSTVVVEGNRTLRATWSPELAQNLQAFHGIDVEAELSRLLTEQLTQQINRTLIQEFLTIQPFNPPTGNLFYLDYQYEGQYLNETISYPDGSWSVGNLFVSSIGIKTEIKKFEFI